MAYCLRNRWLFIVFGVIVLGAFPYESVGAEAGMTLENKRPIGCDITNKVDPRGVPVTHVGWQKHVVVRREGTQGILHTPARFLFISGAWPYSNAQMPYLVYMPQMKRLLMSAEVGAGPVHTILTSSDDFGDTWSEPRWMHTNDSGEPDFSCIIGLSYLGNGKLIAASDTYWFSQDYGQTWTDPVPAPKSAEGKPMYSWDPVLVDKDPVTGQITRLAECRYWENGVFDTAEYFSQAGIHFSDDEGRSWSKETVVPQWRGVNEVTLVRAKNGDLVAACRLDNPVQFLGLQNDQYSGLATSVSHDDGKTWSELNKLYWWGRHHPHMVVLPRGDIVLTYVVRNGYLDDENGFPRFGVEAVISHDNGKTWDLDHKYVLASWTAKIKNTWWGSPQSTTTVILPDGALLTAFGTGLRNVPEQTICKMDVALVRWRPSNKLTDTTKELSDVPFDSDLRNKFDLETLRRK